MYCRSEICIAALKYVLLHQNIYCHSEICYPDGLHTLANHHYTVQYGHRPTNGSIPSPCPLTVLIPGSHCVLPLVPTRRNFLSMSKTFAGSHRPLTSHQRVHRSLNAPLCVLTMFLCPPAIYHMLAHGRLSRHHVTAA